MTPSPTLLPDDVHNRTLVERAHPHAWKNPEPAGRYTLVGLAIGVRASMGALARTVHPYPTQSEGARFFRWRW